MLRNSPDGWGLVARLFHWVMAVLILGMLGLGLYIVQIEQDLANRYLLTQWHKSFGFTVFALAVLRLVWRLAYPVRPQLPRHVPAWQSSAARISHALLYLLMFAIPTTGWLMASASPLNDPDAFPFRIPNMVFDLFELPDPIAKGSKPAEDFLRMLHLGLALTLAALLIVHAGAALKHHFIDRDNVLTRMITGR